MEPVSDECCSSLEQLVADCLAPKAKSRLEKTVISSSQDTTPSTQSTPIQVKLEPKKSLPVTKPTKPTNEIKSQAKVKPNDDTKKIAKVVKVVDANKVVKAVDSNKDATAKVLVKPAKPVKPKTPKVPSAIVKKASMVEKYSDVYWENREIELSKLMTETLTQTGLICMRESKWNTRLVSVVCRAALKKLYPAFKKGGTCKWYFFFKEEIDVNVVQDITPSVSKSKLLELYNKKLVSSETLGLQGPQGPQGLQGLQDPIMGAITYAHAMPSGPSGPNGSSRTKINVVISATHIVHRNQAERHINNHKNQSNFYDFNTNAGHSGSLGHSGSTNTNYNFCYDIVCPSSKPDSELKALTPNWPIALFLTGNSPIKLSTTANQIFKTPIIATSSDGKVLMDHDGLPQIKIVQVFDLLGQAKKSKKSTKTDAENDQFLDRIKVGFDVGAYGVQLIEKMRLAIERAALADPPESRKRGRKSGSGKAKAVKAEKADKKANKKKDKSVKAVKAKKQTKANTNGKGTGKNHSGQKRKKRDDEDQDKDDDDNNDSDREADYSDSDDEKMPTTKNANSVGVDDNPKNRKICRVEAEQDVSASSSTSAALLQINSTTMALPDVMARDIARELNAIMAESGICGNRDLKASGGLNDLTNNTDGTDGLNGLGGLNGLEVDPLHSVPNVYANDNDNDANNKDVLLPPLSPFTD